MAQPARAVEGKNDTRDQEHQESSDPVTRREQLSHAFHHTPRMRPGDPALETRTEMAIETGTLSESEWKKTIPCVGVTIK